MKRLCLLLLLVVAAIAINGLGAPQAARGAPSKSGGPKLSDRLSELSDLSSAGALSPAAAQQSAQVSLAPPGPGSLMRTPAGDLVVDVRVANTSQATLAAVSQHGATVIHVSPDYRIVTAS